MEGVTHPTQSYCHTTRVLIRPGVDPNSNDYNGGSLSHAPPYGSISPDTKGTDRKGENGEITYSGGMKEYGEYNTTTGFNYTHLNNNNSNECEHVHRVPYSRRIDKDDVNAWVGSRIEYPPVF